MKKNEPIIQKQAKILLRTAVQLSKITGRSQESSLVMIVKNLAGHKVKLRNKG